MKELSERELLLKNAKSSCSLNEIPVIHPRYGAIYKNLYQTKPENPSSLSLRIMVSLILFLLFMTMEQGYFTDTPVTTTQIIEQIEMPFYVSPNLDYL